MLKITADLLIPCALLCFLWSTALPGYAQEKVSKADILSQIQRRQASVRSAKFTWKQESFEAKGARRDPSNTGPMLPSSEQLQNTGPVPSEDDTYTHTFSFSFEGSKTNFISEQRMYDKSSNPQHCQTRRTFDGASQQSLRQPWAKTDYPYGTIYKDGARNLDLGMLFLEPILQCYRLPMPEETSPQQETFDLDSTETEVRGMATVTLSLKTSKLRRVFSLDPARGFLPIRYSLESGDHVQRQTDFEYRSDSEVGWVLAGWEIVKFSRDDAVTHRYSAVITDYAINPQLNPSEFTIVFPPGTWIDDLRENANFIQRADGNRRRVMVSEFGMPIKDLLKTEPGAIRPERIRWMLILGNTAILCIAVLFFARKWLFRGVPKI